MPIPEFPSHFGTEAQYDEALQRSRWPQGPRRSECPGTQHYLMVQGARKLYQCNGCRLQTSLVAGTFMEHTKLPLTTYRFNHRFDLQEMIAELIVDVARTKPTEKRVIGGGHDEERF